MGKRQYYLAYVDIKQVSESLYYKEKKEAEEREKEIIQSQAEII